MLVRQDAQIADNIPEEVICRLLVAVIQTPEVDGIQRFHWPVEGDLKRIS